MPRVGSCVMLDGGTEILRKGGGAKIIVFRPGTVILSVLMGTIIWFYVDSSRTIERSLGVDLALHLPVDWELDSDLPERIEVTLRGPRQVMASLKPDALRFDLAIDEPKDPQQSLYEGSRELSPEDLRGLPPEVQIRSLGVSRLTIRMARLVKKFLRVKVSTDNQPASGYMVAMAQAEPWYVSVLVREGFINEEDVIETEPLDLKGKTNGFGDWVYLKPFVKAGRMLRVDKQIYASVEIIEKPSTRIIEEKIPVHLLIAPGEAGSAVALEPAAVTVTVEGFVENVTKLKPADLHIFVDARRKIPDGEGQFTVAVEALPLTRANVTKIVPAKIRWVVLKNEKAPVAERSGAVGERLPPDNLSPAAPNSAAASEGER